MCRGFASHTSVPANPPVALREYQKVKQRIKASWYTLTFSYDGEKRKVLNVLSAPSPAFLKPTPWNVFGSWLPFTTVGWDT